MEQHPPHYVGHRARLKKRWLENQPQSFLDYELLELLLFYSIPRKDVKPIAKNLLQNFGNFTNLFNVNKELLFKECEINENTYIIFGLITEFINRILKNKIQNNNILGSWASLLDYLTAAMGNLKREQFRVLFLNKKNCLITDEVIAQGTVDQTPVYPREIIKKALYYEASAIILVHNHPSGNIKPSKADIELTKKIVNSCEAIEIVVHDHVIITSNQYYSFKSNMLL